MASTLDLLDRLNSCAVEYVLVGGVAAVVHGSQLVTEDVDICAPLDETTLDDAAARVCIYRIGQRREAYRTWKGGDGRGAGDAVARKPAPKRCSCARRRAGQSW